MSTINDLVAAAISGSGRSLLLRGEPGIGKSALLGAARGLARDVRTLDVTGVPSETSVPNAGLLTALRPLFTLLPRITDSGGAALRKALGFEAGPPPTPFAIAGATLELLAAAAVEQVTLLIIDDIQWVDEQSVFALLFALRRLPHESISALIATRPGAIIHPALSEMSVLELTGLTSEHAYELLTTHGDISTKVATELQRYTGGNPLALLELSRGLSTEQRQGGQSLDFADDFAVNLRRRFESALETLAAAQRLALMVAALDSTREAHIVHAALHRLGVPHDILDSPALRYYVHRENDSLSFRHPLIRAAAAAGTASGQRAAHLALARELSAQHRHHESAWHRSEVTPGVDHEMAEMVASAGRDAQQRGDLQIAARLYERAAQHSPDAHRSAQLLAEAGEFATVSGNPRGPALLELARHRSTDSVLHGRIDLVLARYCAWTGDSAGVARIAARSDSIAPRSAAQIHACAASLAISSVDAAGLLAHVDAAYQPRLFTSDVEAIHLLIVAEACRAMFDVPGFGIELPIEEFLTNPDPDLGSPLALLLLAYGADETALRVVHGTLRVARQNKALPAIAWLKSVQAQCHYIQGDLASARACAHEAVELGLSIGGQLVQANAYVWLASVEVVGGAVNDCQEHINRAQRLSTETGAALPGLMAALVQARLSVRGGFDDLAIVQYEALVKDLDSRGVRGTTWVPALPELIECLARTGHRARAREYLPLLETCAKRLNLPVELAALAHCEAMTTSDDTLDESFQTALTARDRSPNPLARSVTLLAWGQRLRRARRPKDARTPLTAALQCFEEMGAETLIRTTRRELLASGGRVPSMRAANTSALTPQEREVSIMAATGASNIEIAARLFLSPKTVEAHLTRSYRKLNIRSRAALSTTLRDTLSVTSADH